MSRAKAQTLCVVARNSNVPFSRWGETMIAMDEQAGYCYSLNAPAARIWELIQRPISIGDLCASLSREFVVEQNTCIQDVCDLLVVMREAGLVSLTDAPTD
jgi:hypothetical protein